MKQVIDGLMQQVKEEAEKSLRIMDGFEESIEAATSEYGNTTASKHISISLANMSNRFRELSKRMYSVRSYVTGLAKEKAALRRKRYAETGATLPPRPPKPPLPE